MCEHCYACEFLYVTHRVKFRSGLRVDAAFYCVTREGYPARHSMLSVCRHRYRDPEYVQRTEQELLLKAHNSVRDFGWRLAAWVFKDAFYRRTDMMDRQALFRLFEGAVAR